jgi:signal transduction histidine kinase
MVKKQKIKASDVVKDIRAGMNDSGMSEKYGLSVEALHRVFREILNSGLISDSEIYRRYDSAGTPPVFADRRESHRNLIDFSLPVYEQENPDARGMVHDISETGLRVRDIPAKQDDVKTLVIYPEDLLMTPPVVLEAKCRWIKEGNDAWMCEGGFQITRVVEGNLEELIILIQCLSFEENDSSDIEPEEEEDSPTELVRLGNLSTLTIDIDTLFPEDVTSSGSFDLRGIQETSFGRLLEALPIPALVLDESHNVFFANRACNKISRRQQVQIGIGFESVFPVPSLAEKAGLIVEEVFATRRPDVITAILKFQERYVWGRVHFRSVRMGGDRFLLVLIEDLTSEKKQILMTQKHNEEYRRQIAHRRTVEMKLEKALALSTELRREAEAADKSKSEFLANVGHELRTPLNAIIGLADILEDQSHGTLNQTQSEYVGVVAQSGRHLLKLINDVLDLASADSGKLELHRDKIDLGGTMEACIAGFREKAVDRGVEIRLPLDDALSLMEFHVDQTIFKRILSNLLSNAVKFTPEGGTIDVKALTKGNDVVVSVSDTGIGIKPEDQERIFHAFEQVDASYSRKHKGTGLGLDLTRKLVEVHGGRIWVESEGEGKGSVFSFSLPGLMPDKEPHIRG